ncbi:hypothetical protein MIR68_000253 [Amoeboaphelidium protococcarum]|nr:hypothetical protein MIR68_000253 [Amoeboaphelidium protococcarum]
MNWNITRFMIQLIVLISVLWGVNGQSNGTTEDTNNTQSSSSPQSSPSSNSNSTGVPLYQNNTNNPLGMVIFYAPQYDDLKGKFGACIRVGSAFTNVSITQPWQVRFRYTNAEIAIEQNKVVLIQRVKDAAGDPGFSLTPPTQALSRIEGRKWSSLMCFNGTYPPLPSQQQSQQDALQNVPLPDQFDMMIQDFGPDGQNFQAVFQASYQNLTNVPTTPPVNFLRIIAADPQSATIKSKPQLAGAVIGSIGAGLIISAIIAFCLRSKGNGSGFQAEDDDDSMMFGL